MGLFSQIASGISSLFKKKEQPQVPQIDASLFSSIATNKPATSNVPKFDLGTTPTAASSAQVRTQSTVPSTPTTNRQNTPSAPTTQLKQPTQTQTNPYVQSMNDLFKLQQTTNEQSEARRKAAAEQQNQAYVDQIRGSYNRQNESLVNQIPFLQSQSDASKAELLAAAEDIRKSGVIQKDEAEENYGEALLQGAKTGREGEQKLKNLFASLGTLDSSQFRDAMINSTEAVTTGQQKTLREKARELSRIENTVQEAQRKAQGLVQQEVAKFNETIRKINETVGMNDQAKEEEIRTAWATLQTTLAEVDDVLAQNEVTLAQARTTFQKEQLDLEKGKAGYGLSDTFLNTGEPTTPEEEYILRQGETAAQSIINGYLTLGDIEDPTIRAIAQDIVAQSGVSAPGSNASKASAKDLNIAVTGLDDIAQLRSIFQSNPNQAKTTKIPFAGQSYDALIENVTDKIGRLRSGGAINADEEARFKRLLPTFWDTSDTVEFKLAQLEREFQGLAGM